ncbi:UNKNOWN [Stylonychia lemnae]|uniref:Uncharacterized protein n=1 Tax=Stylonychia lemnae TaxID=5949 RepID=A0A077ZVW5_STYLE|nr:UNKNOWN [Stylonychia lemnae]|eukprot:CDW73395.1 UNKNOWN [Stylonychia lemnae]
METGETKELRISSFKMQINNSDTQKASSKKNESVCSMLSTKSEITEQQFDSSKQMMNDDSIEQKLSAFQGSIDEDSEIKDQKEEDFILNVLPLRELQEKEKQLCLHSQIFIRKYSSCIKKKILLNALNMTLVRQGKGISLQQQTQTAEDQSYQTEFLVLINQGKYPQPMVELTAPIYSQLIMQHPEFQLLMLHEHPLILEYFSDNIQLLYWLDRLRPIIQKEWSQHQEVKPCYIQQDNNNEVFVSKKYPHFCWHKAKRLLSMSILEMQADMVQNPNQNGAQASQYESQYIAESIGLIKEQKGISKLKISKAMRQVKDSKGLKKLKKLPEMLTMGLNQVQFSDDCHFKREQDQLNPSLQNQLIPFTIDQDTILQSSNNSKQQGIKKRVEKKEQFLVCSYCKGVYHLCCIVTQHRWNFTKEQNTAQHLKGQDFSKKRNINIVTKDELELDSKEQAKLKRGRKRKSPTQLDDLYQDIQSNPSCQQIPQSERKQSIVKGNLSSTNQKASNLKQLDDMTKDEVSQFLTRIGYSGEKGCKWACKNCIFGFLIDHLSSGGDPRFANEVAQTDLRIEQIQSPEKSQIIDKANYKQKKQ